MVFTTEKRVSLSVTLSDEEYSVIDKALKGLGWFLDFDNVLKPRLLKNYCFKAEASDFFSLEAKALLFEILDKASIKEADEIIIR